MCCGNATISQRLSKRCTDNRSRLMRIKRKMKTAYNMNKRPEDLEAWKTTKTALTDKTYCPGLNELNQLEMIYG